MKCLCVLIAVTAALSWAADPIGRITSAGPVTLGGTSVPATAVSMLPVVAGDEIRTSNLPAVIVFADRSRAAIEPNSSVKLEAEGASVRLRVLSGAATATGRASLLIKAATAGSAVTDTRSKHCPPGHDGSDGNCGFGNDSIGLP